MGKIQINLDQMVNSINLDDFLSLNFEQKIMEIISYLNIKVDSTLMSILFYHLYNKSINCGFNDGRSRLLLTQSIKLDPSSKLSRKNISDFLDVKKNNEENLLYVITSCEKYLDKSTTLHSILKNNSIPSIIVVGDETKTYFEFLDPLLIVPTADNYESLPFKILWTFYAIREIWGDVNVLKIDDDCFVNDSSKLKIKVQPDWPNYFGKLVNIDNYDRCFHLGKCQFPTPPNQEKFNGPWIQGGAYYLSSFALSHIISEFISFPGVFSGCILEDKMVGDCLRRNNIFPSNIDISELMGISVELTDRLNISNLRP